MLYIPCKYCGKKIAYTKSGIRHEYHDCKNGTMPESGLGQPTQQEERKTMKTELAIVLSLGEIKAQNFAWLQRMLKKHMPESLTDDTANGLENAKTAMIAIPLYTDSPEQHIQFWLEHCSNYWYDSQPKENRERMTNVIVEYTDNYNKLYREWLCCNDSSIYG